MSHPQDATLRDGRRRFAVTVKTATFPWSAATLVDRATGEVVDFFHVNSNWACGKAWGHAVHQLRSEAVGPGRLAA
jgi:hypothetical protein